MGLFGKIFKSDNARNVAKLEKIAKKVEDLADKYSAIRETVLYFRKILHSKTLYRYAYVFLSLIVFRIL